jgi:hypothetical protein
MERYHATMVADIPLQIETSFESHVYVMRLDRQP